MRAIILAISASVTIVAFTALGSLGYCNILDNLEDMVDETRITADARAAEEYFLKWEFFLSLGVSDSALDNIEITLRELSSISDSQGSPTYESTKSRLICEITQLRRLLGFNLKSIF